MLHKIKSTAATDHTGAMEADTISKNGRNSKSHMSRGNFLRIVCFVLFAGSIVFTGCDQKNIRWEYKYETYPITEEPDIILKRFNQLGREGWELVSVGAYASCFKRRLTNQDDYYANPNGKRKTIE